MARASQHRMNPGGATVRSPNCDLRGSSVTCASHGGTAKRLARMLQRSLDPACNGFVTGLASPSSNTVDTVTVRYLLTDGTVITGWRYGWAMLAPDWLPQPGPSEQWTSQGGGGTSREQSREEPTLFSSSRRTHRLIFFGRDSAGARPFPFRVLFLCGAQPCETVLSCQSIDRRCCSPFGKGFASTKKKKRKQRKQQRKNSTKKEQSLWAAEPDPNCTNSTATEEGASESRAPADIVCRSPSSTGISGQMDHLTILGMCIKARSSGRSSISLRPPRLVLVIYPLAIQSAKFLLASFRIYNPAEVGA